MVNVDFRSSATRTLSSKSSKRLFNRVYEIPSVIQFLSGRTIEYLYYSYVLTLSWKMESHTLECVESTSVVTVCGHCEESDSKYDIAHDKHQ